MSDDLDAAELALGERIGALAAAGTGERDAADVARRSIARRPAGWSRRRWLPLAAAAAVVVAVAGFMVAAPRFGGTASFAATAHVRGETYDFVSIVRTIRLEGATLTPFGEATQDGGLRTIGDTAYRLDEIDPARVLVMRLVAGQSDGGGPVGDYLLLVRDQDSFRLACPYFAPGDPLGPAVCR